MLQRPSQELESLKRVGSIAVTNNDRFALHASKRGVEEVNFWEPSPEATFKALTPGEILLFKLHAPDNYIAGGGFFTRFLQLPLRLAWDSFGEGNGVRSMVEMRDRIAYYRYCRDRRFQ